MKKEELLSYFTQLVPDGNWKGIGYTWDRERNNLAVIMAESKIKMLFWYSAKIAK